MDKPATIVLRVEREVKRMIEDASDEKGITIARYITELVIAQQKREAGK